MEKTEQTLTQQELDERILILKRLRQLLCEQRQKFQEYLTVLEKQERCIIEEDSEKLFAQSELEQHIVGNITTLQKVITPMEHLYTLNEAPGDDIPILKTDLATLQEKILVQNEKNRKVLREQIDSIRTKIAGFQNPYRKTRSVYAQSAQSARIISIDG